jgi:hypothetical protein
MQLGSCCHADLLLSGVLHDAAMYESCSLPSCMNMLNAWSNFVENLLIDSCAALATTINGCRAFAKTQSRRGIDDAAL